MSKLWHEVLLDKNENLSLQDLVEYKQSDMTILIERLVEAKMQKIKEGVDKGIIEKSMLENESVIRKDAIEASYKYDLVSLGERFKKFLVEREYDEALIDDGKALIEQLFDTPTQVLGTGSFLGDTTDFFAKELGVAKDWLTPIMGRKRQQLAINPQPTEKKKRAKKEVKQESIEQKVENSAVPELVFKNGTDHNIVVRAHHATDGRIYIELLPDIRVQASKPIEVIHLRHRVRMYAEQQGLAEYDTATVEMVFNG